MKKRITTLIASPQKILWIDASAALWSIALLGFILPNSVVFSGFPMVALQFLALFPVGFLGFNLYLQRQEQLESWMLRTLYIGQYMFLITTFSLVMFNIHHITSLGLLVMIAQMCLTAAVALFEFRGNVALEKQM